MLVLRNNQTTRTEHWKRVLNSMIIGIKIPMQRIKIFILVSGRSKQVLKKAKQASTSLKQDLRCLNPVSKSLNPASKSLKKASERLTSVLKNKFQEKISTAQRKNIQILRLIMLEPVQLLVRIIKGLPQGGLFCCCMLCVSK
jgi:hypothetical protein